MSDTNNLLLFSASILFIIAGLVFYGFYHTLNLLRRIADTLTEIQQKDQL